jgi:hypothetical protein
MGMVDKPDALAIDTTPPKSSKRLHIVGFVITGFWLAGLAIYLVSNFETVWSMPPNEHGDFMAGAFAPLAFLWLVLGFFQQGEELRHSGRALWLQGRELQNSVEQQRELVNVTREQLAFESEMLNEQRAELVRSTRPLFRLADAGSAPGIDGKRSFRVRIINVGRRCTDFKVYLNGNHFQNAPRVLEPELSYDLSILLHPKDVTVIPLKLTYIDERLNSGSAEFEMHFEAGSFRFTNAGTSDVAD